MVATACMIVVVMKVVINADDHTAATDFITKRPSLVVTNQNDVLSFFVSSLVVLVILLVRMAQAQP